MNVPNYAPLIEFHGFLESDIVRIKKLLFEGIESSPSHKEKLKKMTFSVVKNRVTDISNTSRPFLRMYSSEYVLVHEIIAILKKGDYENEVEFIKITNYFDFRKNK